jgi:hypothetical protein
VHMEWGVERWKFGCCLDQDVQCRSVPCLGGLANWHHCQWSSCSHLGFIRSSSKTLSLALGSRRSCSGSLTHPESASESRMLWPCIASRQQSEASAAGLSASFSNRALQAHCILQIRSAALIRSHSRERVGFSASNTFDDRTTAPLALAVSYMPSESSVIALNFSPFGLD